MGILFFSFIRMVGCGGKNNRERTENMTECKVENGRLTVYVPRELDDHAAREIRERVDPVLEGQWIRTLIFDFGNTAFMDSSGIGMILGRYKKMHYGGGKVKAVHMNDRIRRMLVLSGLYQVVQLEKKEDQT